MMLEKMIDKFRVIIIEDEDPRRIAAIDQIMLERVGQKRSPPTLVFYSWQKSISISYGQNISDINMEKAKELGFKVVRMDSGGRAVIHDSKTDFSFSLFFPTPTGKSKHFAINNYNTYSQRLANALEHAKVPVEVRNHYDIFAKNKKLCGIAQKIIKTTMVQGIIIDQMPNEERFDNMINVMDPSMYGKEDVQTLRGLMTGVDQFSKITRTDLICQIALHLSNNNNPQFTTLKQDEEQEIERKFEELKMQEFDSRGNKRGLCWLPRGMPKGTYVAENPGDYHA